MTNVDIRALAKLARLAVSDAEVQKLEQEFPAILSFVEAIQKADVSAAENDQELRNVMRDDANPIESGAYTEALLTAAPSTKDNRVAVKQVISRKQK